MQVSFWKHSVGRFLFTVKEWSCCGRIWQLLLSSRYPDRVTWSPTCPVCGSYCTDKYRDCLPPTYNAGRSDDRAGFIPQQRRV